MKKYLLNKNIFLPALLFIFSFCNEPAKEKDPEMVKPKTFVEDPYFVETTDTVSTHGPRNITRNLVQDNNGNYWLATWEGIIKFDGKVFTNYTLKAGLRKFHVFSVIKDKNGNLWFGTIGGGAYKYDLASGTFTNFTTKDGLVGNDIDCLLEDKAGNIWFGTNDGVSKYDRSATLRTGSKIFTNFSTKDGLKNNNIHSITQDHTGMLWFGTDKGVCIYDGRYFINFTNNLNQPFLNVRDIIEDKKGNIWIGSEGEGLCKYDGKTLLTVKPNFVSYLLEDRAGNIWFSASAEGQTATPNFPVNGAKNTTRDVMALSRYDGKTFSTICVKQDPNDFQIFSIYEDSSGSIWFGTMQGICRYDTIKETLNYFKDVE